MFLVMEFVMDLREFVGCYRVNVGIVVRMWCIEFYLLSLN